MNHAALGSLGKQKARASSEPLSLGLRGRHVIRDIFEAKKTGGRTSKPIWSSNQANSTTQRLLNTQAVTLTKQRTKQQAPKPGYPCSADAARLRLMPNTAAAADPATPTDDHALMQRYQDGDAAAFDQLYQRHKGPLYRYLRRHGLRQASADELFQDIWMKVINAREQWTAEAKFTTWLYRIAHNRIVDEFRRQARRPEAALAEQDELLDSAPNQQAQQQNEDLKRALQIAIASLPVEQRSAFLLKEESGLSLQAIAEIMGVDRETVKSRLRYAVNKLRQQLADQRQEVLHDGA